MPGRRAKNLIRIALNNTFGRCPRRAHPAKPNILVFSSRRSGSTWLLELLSSERQTKYITQPYDVVLGHNPYAHLLPQPYREHFIDVDAQATDQIRQHYDALCSGHRILNTQWRVWKPNFHLTYNRIIFKLFYVKHFMGIFATEYADAILYLVRHPVAASLSNLKIGWPSALPAFLQHPTFVQTHLNESQRELIDEISTQGTPLEGYVAGWFLENWLPFQLVEQHNIRTLKYEQLVQHPRETIAWLCGELDLNDQQQMLTQHGVPSATTKSSVSKISSGDKQAISASWRAEVDLDQHPRLAPLFAAFANPFYQQL